LIFVLLTEGYLAYSKKESGVAALLWSVAIMLKVFPAIILLFLILRKEWKTLGYVGFMCLLLTGASILVMGFEVWQFYLIKVLPSNSSGEISAMYTTNYQSAFMLFKYLFIREESLNPDPFFDNIPIFQICLIAFKCILLTLCGTLILARRDFISFGFLLLGAILFSPYSSTYGNLLLVFLLVAFIKDGAENKIAITVALLIMLVGNLPIKLFQNFPLLFQFPRLLLTLSLFIYIFYITKVKFNWKLLAVFTLFFTLPALLTRQPENTESKRLLTNENHNLIFDYGSTNGYIFYKYWSDDGEQIFNTELPAYNLSQVDLRITDNQLFYKGKQLTHSADKKLKPMIWNNRHVIYLSDKDKGMGFYTLRMIER
jgi:hypothetical protein